MEYSGEQTGRKRGLQRFSLNPLGGNPMVHRLSMPILVLLVLSGCSSQGSNTLTNGAVTSFANRGGGTFSWRVYDGQGDVNRAVYTFDGEDLGRGDVGLLSFERIVKRSAAGSSFVIEPYYSPLERPQRLYPMNGNPIWDRLTNAGEERNVFVLYPGLAFP